MNARNWFLSTEQGYTFEFTYKSNENIVIRVIASNKREAWRKLVSIK
ncbi:hypothetical protein J9303_13810 [Bacillaceae bacterium Marseille-Q3522]|nr:hypothetical protein [Bacillaceae bacterium Marseille-Q3522]